MAVVKNLMVRAGADFSAITTQANKAKTSMTGMQTSVSKSCSKMTSSVRSMGKVFAAIGVTLSAAAITAFAKDAKAAYESQAEAEAKLAQVMRNTIGASQAEIQSIKDLVSAQQALGVVGDEVQLAGAQELATYVSMTSTLQKLIPVMNDMVAQQYGYSATAENATNIATMLGKVLSGQTSGLSRYGYYFTSGQAAILKFGTEAQKAATLAEVVEQSVGGMNAALAATPSGRLKQVSNTLGDIKENFGLAVTSIATTFIPALNGACAVLANLATLANKVAQAIANVFGGGAASSVATVVGYTGAATEAMEDLTDATKGAGKAAKGLGTFGFDTIQKISGGSSSAGAAAADTGGGAGGAGAITETAEGASEAAETVGWLEKGLARLKETVDNIDFSKLTGALDRLKTSTAPLTSSLFSGLKWAYDNVLDPLAKWSIEDAIPSFLGVLGTSAQAVAGPLQRLGTALQPLVSTAFDGIKWAYDNVFIPFASWTGGNLAPAFLDALASAASLLSAAVSALQPMATWLWESFLQPIASWTGGVIVAALNGITTALQGVSKWISENQGPVQAMTGVVAAFFGAWTLGTLAEFVINAGGIAKAIGAITTALKACTVAKIADKVETLAICALYVKDWAVALAGNVVAVGKDVAAWIALRAEWIAGKAALLASTAAQVAHTAASWAGTAATTALGVAINVLTSPITLVIAAIAALVAGIVLLVKNWDTVKAAGAAAWEMIKGAWADASGWFTSNVIEPLSNGFKGLTNGVIGFFESLANAGIGAVNGIIGGLNKISIKTPDWVPGIGGKQFGINIPTIPTFNLPRLAEGAVFPGGHPYAAIVNDQTSGVNVETPLDTIKQAVAEVMSTIQLILKVTAGPGLTRYLSYELEKEGTRRGGRAIGGHA